MLDGDWYPSDDGRRYTLKMGGAYRAEVYMIGQAGQFGSRWSAVLNGNSVYAPSDLDGARGAIERHIVDEMMQLRAAFVKMKARAPSSAQLYGER